MADNISDNKTVPSVRVQVTNLTLAPVPNSTPTTDLKSTVTPRTGSVMTKVTEHCSLEDCAKEHLTLVICVSGFNLVILILLLLSICVRWNCSNKSSKKDVEAIKLKEPERTTTDQSGDQSPTTISPAAPPPRKPLPLPPNIFRQTSSAGDEHPTYLEIISDDSLDYREQRIGNSQRTQGSRRALIPPSQYNHSPTQQPSSSVTNTTDDYEISSYLQPRDRPIVRGAGPYAELSYEKRQSRADSTTKSKGYLGLNSLTRIRAKIKRKRTDS